MLLTLRERNPAMDSPFTKRHVMCKLCFHVMTLRIILPAHDSRRCSTVTVRIKSQGRHCTRALNSQPQQKYVNSRHTRLAANGNNEHGWNHNYHRDRDRYVISTNGTAIAIIVIITTVTITHYNHVSVHASQLIGNSIVCSTVSSRYQHRKHQAPYYRSFVWHTTGGLDSPHKGPVMLAFAWYGVFTIPIPIIYDIRFALRRKKEVLYNWFQMNR